MQFSKIIVLRCWYFIDHFFQIFVFIVLMLYYDVSNSIIAIKFLLKNLNLESVTNDTYTIHSRWVIQTYWHEYFISSSSVMSSVTKHESVRWQFTEFDFNSKFNKSSYLANFAEEKTHQMVCWWLITLQNIGQIQVHFFFLRIFKVAKF